MIKQDLLHRLISKNPIDYFISREEMYEYIMSGVLTYEDLVVRSNILDDVAYNHIKNYPRIIDEQSCLPVIERDELPMPNLGNIEIYNFGISGSGGKTSLLAALMTLFDNVNFILRETEGAVYARYLSDYMFRNALPPATSVHYVQLINTSLRVKTKWHDISFIEFSGENALDIAGDDNPTFVSSNVGPYLVKLLNSKNKKILLFAIDLSITTEIPIRYEETRWINLFESDVAECWASRLGKDLSFCKKIAAIKIIVTKKDLWNITTTQQAINALVDNGYKVFYEAIVDLCHKYKIMEYNNFMPEVMPFSIGKFMPGEVYNFDNTDAKSLLNSIRRDIDLNHTSSNFAISIRKILKI